MALSVVTDEDPGLPDRLDTDVRLALPTLLRRRAQEQGDRVFLRHVDGSTLTHGGLEDLVRRWKRALREHGVGPGDRVLTLLPPSFDAVAVWMAAARLGAIEVPANTALRGEFLAHVVRDADPRCVVAAGEFVRQLDEVAGNGEPVAPVLVVGPADPAPALRTTAPRLDEPIGRDAGDDVEPGPGDIATIVYTSGTSGRSKGVLVTWAQAYATARWLCPVEDRHGDVWYGPWAMYHVSGKVGLYSSALLDGELVLRDGFSTSSFWDDVRRFGVTSVMIVASTVAFLQQQPPRSDDRDHTLRNVVAAPMPADPQAFVDRFGVRLATVFNMTEVSCPITTGWWPFPAGSCGRPRPGVEARVVDESGADVPIGGIGELALRTTVPHETMAGYWRAPEATVEAWRDLWFHTGDAVRKDAAGNYFFVDRMKDTIRRGGENISSAELEAAVTAHPMVRECAAIGVPTAWGDREVKLFVVPEPGLDVEQLAADLDARLPRFMRPTYISAVDELPKTQNHRIKKAELRAMTDDLPQWTRQRLAG